LNSLSTQQDAGHVWFAGIFGWIAALAIVAMTGCAAVGPKTPQEVVGERAQQRWDALVKGDFHAAYAFMSPGSRQVMSEQEYVASLRSDFWKSAKVERVECATPDACDVVLTIEYEFKGRRIKTPFRESWIREGSDWWYVKKA
jgi:hypothetical protein